MSVKTRLALFAALVLGALLSLAICAPQAHAAKPTLPFDLKAPTSAAMDKTGGDSPTTMNLAWNMDSAMTQYFATLAASGDGDEEKARADKLLEELGGEIWMETQIDWALDDSQGGWHSSTAWDDPDTANADAWSVLDSLTYPKAVNTAWIMRGITEDDWNGVDGKPGLKDLLPAGSYTLDTSGGDYNLSIDYGKHTAYARARYAVTVRTDEGDFHYFSDWSPVASYGKDATAPEALTQQNLPAPKIRDLRTADYTFNDNPVVIFNQDVPADLTDRMVSVYAKGGEVRLVPEIRLAGGEWVEVDPCEVQTGEAIAKLVYLAKDGEVIPAGTPMELRCRYMVLPGDGSEDFYSGYSNVISFDSNDVNGGKTDGNDNANGEAGQGNTASDGNANANANQSGNASANQGTISKTADGALAALVFAAAAAGLAFAVSRRMRR